MLESALQPLARYMSFKISYEKKLKEEKENKDFEDKFGAFK